MTRYRPRSGTKDRAFLAAIAAEDLAALRARLVKLVKAKNAPAWRIVAIERAISRALDRQESLNSPDDFRCAGIRQGS